MASETIMDNQVQEQVHGQVQEPLMMMPNNNMALAIFTTICCCLPLGIVAIVKANSVETLYLAKQYNAAIMAANEAKKWSIFGIIFSIIIWVLYLLFFGGIAAIGGIAALGS